MLESLRESKTRLKELINIGVIIDDERTCYIGENCVIESGARIEPNVVIKGDCHIGSGSVIGSNSVIRDMRIGRDCIIRASFLEDSEIDDNTTVGPYAYVRNQSKIGTKCRIGDFVEIKNATLRGGVKAAHLTYIGDAEVGENTNVGCGTVFANYNGVVKKRTQVGSHVFIGANSNLIASVNIGDNAYIAAGSTVTDDVPSGALCIARQRQLNKLEWRDVRKGD